MPGECVNTHGWRCVCSSSGHGARGLPAEGCADLRVTGQSLQPLQRRTGRMLGVPQHGASPAPRGGRWTSGPGPSHLQRQVVKAQTAPAGVAPGENWGSSNGSRFVCMSRIASHSHKGRGSLFSRVSRLSFFYTLLRSRRLQRKLLELLAGPCCSWTLTPVFYG